MVTRFSKFFIILIALIGNAGLFAAEVFAAEPPRLIINIVIGSMDAEAILKYSGRYTDGGLRKLLTEGAVFTDARYESMQTVTPASLATLSTGTMPSTHGTISPKWFDYTTGRQINLTEDDGTTDFDARSTETGHSPRHLTTPALADLMMRADSSSRIVSLALTPVSSIVPGGKRGLCFWLDADRCRWTTSTYYTPLLPSWVKSYNDEDLHARFLTGQWVAKYERSVYVNHRSPLLFDNDTAKKRAAKKQAAATTDIDKILRTPIGNTVLFDFAKYAVKCLNLGNDEHPDMLNICLDTSAEIAERYGQASVEYEDMIYRLDADLKEFLAYINVHLKEKDSVLIVLTSAHGTSPAYDTDGIERDRFNVQQFEVIMNAYLNAKYGPGDWVLGYSDRSLYLNRNFVDEKRLSLIDIQNETAAFALRFRGVSHALTSTTLQSSHFAGGYAHRMQNGFYPRRSGDVVLNLMPETVEEREGYVSQSGSMHGYDTHVPLIFFGAGVKPQTRTEAVGMTSVAPTLANMLGLGELPAAEAKPLILK